MAQSLPKACQGLGESQPKSARVLAPRLNPPHAQKTLQSGLKSPDGLLEKFILVAFQVVQTLCATGLTKVTNNWPWGLHAVLVLSQQIRFEEEQIASC